LTDIEQIRAWLAPLDTASVCDADKSLRVLDPLIRPVGDDCRIVGLAVPVACRDDFLPVIRALADASAGDVLVVDAGAGTRAVAGELFTTEAARKGLAGIVVDGAVRDVASIRRLPVPVFARYACPMAGFTQAAGSAPGQVNCGGVIVRRGEIVFADDDGILVLSPAEFDAVHAKAAEIQQTEERLLERMAQGESLLSFTNFEAHWEDRVHDKDSSLRFRL
jgi:4-hydroxy-4-methyl-2-oxoglutarate aldolase